jgi:EmrB/QacA subfamily drug resistance transporter
VKGESRKSVSLPPSAFHLPPILSEQPPLPAVAGLTWYRWLVVGTVCVGAFLGQLDASIAGLVLPTLEDAFRAPVASVEWVAIAYLLTLAVLVVPIGRLADLAGRKLLYTSGFLVFVCGSFLCGLAPGLGWLIGFRVVQALGAAMLQANSVAIITAAVQRRQLGRAIGFQAAAQAVGLSVGPSVGGVLIDALGWQWVFFIAVPFGLLGTALGWLVLPCTERSTTDGRVRRFDWLGTALLAPSVGCVFLLLTFGTSWGWTSPWLVGTALVAGVGLASFLFVERRMPSPLVDLSLLRVPAFGMGLLAALVAYAVLFGTLFLLPFYLQRVLGFDARTAGLLLTPLPVAIGVLAPVAGLVTDRLGARLPTTAGLLVAGAALLLLAVVWYKPLGLTLALLGLLGVGLGLFTPPNNSAVMGSAPADRLGMASGVLNMTRSLGTSLGVATTGAILALALAYLTGMAVASTAEAPAAALRVAIHATLYFLAGLSLVGALVSLARGAPEPTVIGVAAPADVSARSLHARP